MIIIEPNADDLERLRQMPESLVWALERLIARTAQETAVFMKNELARQRLAATSQLINSVTAESAGAGLLMWTVGPKVQHGWWVFQGRRPGGKLPPIGAIRDWVRVRRVGDPRIAWAVARKIQQRGLAARDYLTPTVAFAQQRLHAHTQSLLEE